MDTYRRAEALFHEVVAQPPARRAATLAATRRYDEAIVRQVQALLSASEQAATFLERGPIAPSVAAGEKCGDCIERYVLLERIGGGGFGTVWRARQERPVRREVALKIVKPGMDTREVLTRFAAERQALALMDHPNIAQVFDAGATPSGRPYFAMELVRGAPLTTFCDERRLSIGARLRLFLQVCRAVQHAHQKGVIHRDLKPTNLLVAEHDGAPVVKVIDFGIAKAIEQRLTATTLATDEGHTLGTPLYMAPEQLALGARDIDTRADLYALGVILFDLLTGLLPFASAQRGPAAMEEMRRRICEEEPPRPSQVLRRLPASARDEIAAPRGTDPRALGLALRGDLDWIVVRCLEKDRERRYATAHDLALDLERHLAHEPVAAVAPTLRYTAGKFLRRHRASLAAAASLVTLLLAGTAISTREALRARRAERHAETLLAQVKHESEARKEASEARRAALSESEQSLQTAERASRRAVDGEQQVREAEADARATSDWLVRRVLSAAQSEGTEFGLGIHVTLVQALEAAEKTLAQDFAGRPAPEARTRRAIAETWSRLGRYAAAEAHWRRAVALLESAPGTDHAEISSARAGLATALHQLGRHEEAIALLEPLVAAGESRADTLLAAYLATGNRHAALALANRAKGKGVPPGDDSLARMDRLVRIYRESGAPGAAIEPARRALDVRERTLGTDHAETLAAVLSLGRCYSEARRPREAVPLFERVHAQHETTLGPLHPATLQAGTELAAALTAARQLSRALALYVTLLPRCQEVLGAEHPDTLAAMKHYAAALMARGEAARAVPICDRVLAIRTRQTNATHPETTLARLDAAAASEAAGNFPRAIVLYYDVLERRRVEFGPDHPETLRSAHLLAVAYAAARRFESAQPLFDRVIAQRRRTLGPEHPDTLASLHSLGCLQASRGDFPQALETFQHTLAARRRVLGAEAPETIATLASVGEALHALRRFPEAIVPLEQAVDLRCRLLEDESEETLATMRLLAQATDATGASARATERFEQMLPLLEKNRGADADETLSHLTSLAARYTQSKRYERAVQLYEIAATRRTARLGPNHRDTLQSLHALAAVCQCAGDLPRARTLFQQAYARRLATLGVHDETIASADRLGYCLLLASDGAGAVRIFGEGLDLARRVAGGRDHPTVALLAQHLAAALLFAERDAEALAPAREAYWMYQRNAAWNQAAIEHATEVFQSATAAASNRRMRSQNPQTPVAPIQKCWEWPATP